jgi:hypothetical protein
MRDFKINGTSVKVSPNWSISDNINARSMFSGVIIDDVTINNGDEFELYDGATLIFAGIVSKRQKKEQMPGKLYTSIKVSDNSAIADRRTIAKVYVETKAGDIAKDFITEKLGAEGVTIGIIEDGVTIRKAVFNYTKISQALDYLKTTTGFVWNIDNDKKLNFHNRTTVPAAFDILEETRVYGFNQDSNLDQYRNTQYVRGGFTQTSPQPIITQKPDGENRTFTLRFPIAERPDIYVNGVQVSPSDIGINGLTSGKKWYWTYNSNTITHDSSQTVLTSSDTITGTFIGLRRLFVQVDDPVEIATNGIYERLDVEQSISDTSTALEYGSGLLQTYGTIADRVTYTSNTAGLKAGTLQRITRSLYGIDEQFLIESVDITPDGAENMEYNISAIDGAALGGWEEFFKELVRKQADFTISENEVLVLLVNQEEQNLTEGEFDIVELIGLAPSETLVPSETLTPGTITRSVTVND